MNVGDVARYDAFVVGSAAYMFHWLADATQLRPAQPGVLAARPVWLFSSGPLGTDPVDAKGRDQLVAAEPKEFAELRATLHPREGRRSSSARSTWTRRPSAWPSASPGTSRLPQGRPCRPVTSATGRPSTHGPTGSPRRSAHHRRDTRLMTGGIRWASSRLAILTVVVLVLAGCGGAADHEPEPAVQRCHPVPTATAPTASPHPGVSPSSDLAPLAATYTTIAAGGTAAVRQCDREKAAANGTLADAKAIAQACRDGYVKYIAAMKAVAWGPVQAQADAVIAAAEACDAIVLEMVNAADGSTFRAAYAGPRFAAGRLTPRARAYTGSSSPARTLRRSPSSVSSSLGVQALQDLTIAGRVGGHGGVHDLHPFVGQLHDHPTTISGSGPPHEAAILEAIQPAGHAGG